MTSAYKDVSLVYLVAEQNVIIATNPKPYSTPFYEHLFILTYERRRRNDMK